MYLRVDVGLMFRVAHARDDEDDARAAVGVRGDPQGRDVARLLGFDARGQLSQLLPVERRAGELADVLLQSGTEPSSSRPETCAELIRVPSGGSVCWACAPRAAAGPRQRAGRVESCPDT